MMKNILKKTTKQSIETLVYRAKNARVMNVMIFTWLNFECDRIDLCKGKMNMCAKFRIDRIGI